MMTSPRLRIAAMRLVGLLAHDRLGRRETGLVQQRGGVELVHAALDGARRVHDQDTAVLDPVERIDAIDDLFQRPAGDNPRQHGVGVKKGYALRS